MGEIIISKLSPIRFHKSGEGDFTYNLIPGHETKRGYCQKYCHGDKPYVQILHESAAAAMSMALVTNEGTVVKSWTVPFSGETYDTYKVFHWYNYFPFDNVAPEGYYFLRLYVNDSEGQAIFYSEPIYLFANTGKDGIIAIEYNHDENDFYRRFIGKTGNDISPSMIRLEGGLKSDGLQPGGKFDMFQDIEYQSVLLHSIMYNVEKWTFGDGSGLPNWLGEKLNRIFGLSTVKINQVQYARNEGAKLSRSGDVDYPLAGWEIDLVLADNPQSDEYDTDPAALTVDTTTITCDSTLITSDQTIY